MVLACALGAPVGAVLVRAAVVAQDAAAPGEPSAAEKPAIGYLRTVFNAQRQYRKKHNGYATSLAALVGSGSFTRRMVKTDRGDYSVKFSGKTDGFTIALVPKTFDAEHRAFWINENGLIHYETDKPAGENSPVLRQ